MATFAPKTQCIIYLTLYKIQFNRDHVNHLYHYKKGQVIRHASGEVRRFAKNFLHNL